MKNSVLAAIAVAALYVMPAFAADMPQKAPVYKAPPAPQWSWTGLYAGVYAGVGLNRSHGLDPTGAVAGEIDYLGSGFTGGATVGYNWQFDPHWVAGIEGDIGWLGLSHSAPNFQDFTVNSKTSSLGTLRGRIGYTSTGATLAYVTAGAAWVHFDDQVFNPPGFSAESSKTKLGYAVGSGVETRLGGNWTAKSESLFVDVGSGDPVPTGAGSFLQTDKHRYLVQRFGVNYLFGGKPMAPLPQEHWQGFFIGAVGGTASPQTRVSSTDPTVAIGEIGNTGGSAGYTAGLIAGYNWQFAPQWVAGVEGDFSWLGINHSISDYDSPNAFYKLNTRWIATARARLGYSTGPALLYVTGGASVGELRRIVALRQFESVVSNRFFRQDPVGICRRWRHRDPVHFLRPAWSRIDGAQRISLCQCRQRRHVDPGRLPGRRQPRIPLVPWSSALSFRRLNGTS